MGKWWFLAKRDLKSYFSSPVGYFIVAVFIFLMSVLFFTSLYSYVGEAIRARQFGRFGSRTLTEAVVAPLFGNMTTLFMLVIPFFTLRLFAEERKQGTMQLLLTSPLTLYQILFGKFFSGVLFIGILMLFTLFFPTMLFFVTSPDLGPILTGYLGVFLAGCVYLSIGLFCSALTENSIVAGFLALMINLFFWIVGWLSMSAGPVWSDLLNQLSLVGHFQSFVKGLIHSGDIVFYGSFSGLWLFFTFQVLESYRWR